MSQQITTEEARVQTVADIEARIAKREAEKPAEGTPGYSVHEFGTAALRQELQWAKGAKLPYDLWDDGELIEVETFQTYQTAVRPTEINVPGSDQPLPWMEKL